MKKAKPILLVFLIIIAGLFLFELFVYWRGGGFEGKKVIYYMERRYNISSTAPISLIDAEKGGKLEKVGELAGLGGLWANECHNPCTIPTVVFVKQDNGTFQSYALSGGP